MSRSKSIPRRASQPSRTRSCAESVRPAVLRAAVARAQLGQRAQDGRLVDADPVRMAVIEAAQSAPLDPRVLGPGRAGDPRRRSLARVSQIGEGRQQHRHGGRLRVRSAAHRERDQVLALAVGRARPRTSPPGSDAGELDREARRPPEVVDRVGMEVHRPVLLGGQAPVVNVAAPVVTGDRAQRTVDALAVQPVRAGVDDAAARGPRRAARRRPTRLRPARSPPWGGRACRRGASGRARRRAARRRAAAGPRPAPDRTGRPALAAPRPSRARRPRRRECEIEIDPVPGSSAASSPAPGARLDRRGTRRSTRAGRRRRPRRPAAPRRRGRAPTRRHCDPRSRAGRGARETAPSGRSRPRSRPSARPVVAAADRAATIACAPVRTARSAGGLERFDRRPPRARGPGASRAACSAARSPRPSTSTRSPGRAESRSA